MENGYNLTNGLSNWRTKLIDFHNNSDSSPKIDVLGDSIFYGYYAGGEGRTSAEYHADGAIGLLSRTFDAIYQGTNKINVNNVSKSGLKASQQTTTEIQYILNPENSRDLLITNLFTNDRGEALTDYRGYIEDIINAANSDVLLVIPGIRWGRYGDPSYTTLEMADLIQDISEEHNCACIDFLNKDGWQITNPSDCVYYSDGQVNHPNQLGHQDMCNDIFQAIYTEQLGIKTISQKLFK